MAIEDFTLPQRAGWTVYEVIWRATDGLAWDSDDDSFKAIGSAVAPYLATTEFISMGGKGWSVYTLTLNLNRVNNGPIDDYFIGAYRLSGGAPDLTADNLVGYLGFGIENGRTQLTAAVVEAILEDVICGTGSGSCLVNQDYGGKNNLCYTKHGIPVDNAVVTAYLKSDYCAGRTGNAYIKGTTRTTVTGAWQLPLMLDPALYIIQFHKQGVVGPDTVEVCVNC